MKPQWLFLALQIASYVGRSCALAPSENESRFRLHIDDATLLSPGGVLPPMTEVPCSGGPLKAIIKPPNVDDLYQWYVCRDMADSDPSWAILWPTAVSLSNFLKKHPSIVKGKRVVELGAGLALCGLTAAALGAKSVVISDREPYALHCAMATASVNTLDNVQAAVIDWTDENTMVDAADVVIASDVLYDKQTIEAFAKACRRIAVSDGGVVLVTDPKAERIAGARDLLRTALGGHVRMEILDLPVPDDNVPGQSADARDHSSRMKEPTVLFKGYV
jgi:predicted nicotinamide N-methyase